MPPGVDVVTRPLRTKALQEIRRRLRGEQRREAETYVNSRRATSKGIYNLVDRLKDLPDLTDHSTHTRYDQEFKDQVVAEFRAGVSISELSRRYGVSRKAISEWCGPSGRYNNEETRDQAREEFLDGATVGDLAKKYHVAVQTMYAWLKPAREEREMASRQAEQLRMVKRCEKVGWRTEYSGDGVKVFTPEGPRVVHLSPSDGAWSAKNMLKELENCGLLVAEEELKRQNAADRKAKLAQERQAADAKAEQIAKRNGNNSAALIRAAGPYLVEPEDLPLSWFVEAHPAPQMRWVWVNASLADYLLEHHNIPGGAGRPGSNRPQSETRIMFYRDVIVSGQWYLTHQGMAMDRRQPKPMVQDGQHRLAAVVAAQELLDKLREMDPLEREALIEDGSSYQGILNDKGELLNELRVPAAFFVGMDPRNFAAIDDVLLRNANQLFTQAGEKHGGTLQTAARLITAFRSRDPRARIRKRLTNIDSMEVLKEGKDHLRKGAQIANTHARKIPLSNGVLAAAYYLIGTANGFDNRFVEAFWHGVINGVRQGTRYMLDDDDPRQALRTTMSEKKEKGRMPRPIDQLGIVITAWNNLVTGKHVRRMRWADGADLPELLICADRGPNASATPRSLVGEIDNLAEAASE